MDLQGSDPPEPGVVRRVKILKCLGRVPHSF
jgi:hypothetical protein